jgi:hypothetical protein
VTYRHQVAVVLATLNLFLGACASHNVTRDALLEDIDYFVAKVEEAHADPYRETPKPEFFELVDRVKTRIEAGGAAELSVSDGYFALQELAAALQDEHTMIGVPYDSLSAFELYLPIRINVVGDKLVSEQHLGKAEIPRYAEVLEINGVSASTIWQDCRRFLNPPLPHAKAEFFRNQVYFFLATLFDLHSPWTVRYRLTGPETGTVKADGIPIWELAGKRATQQYKAYDAQLDGKSVPVLDIPSFAYGEFEDYRRFIDDFFSKNREKEALVIDLRRNPGGHGAWGYYMLDFLTDSPYRIINVFDFKVSDVFRNSIYRGKAGDRLEDSENGDYIPRAGGRIRTPHEVKHRFRGRVFLLVSHATNSAAVVTAAVFKHNAMGTVIGQETAGRIMFNSDPVAVKLPRTGLTARIPVAIYALPGENADRGVIPDVVVESTLEDLRNDRDRAMETVHELLGSEHNW